MSSYRDDCRKANMLIDNLRHEGKSEAEINYVVGKTFGFGTNFVRKRIEILMELEDKSVQK